MRIKSQMTETGVGKSLTSSVGSQKKLNTARKKTHVQAHILESEDMGVFVDTNHTFE